MEVICKDVAPIQDLKVKIHESSLVIPMQKTQRKSNYFLSNFDQFLNYYVSILQFFSASPDFPPETVAKMLKAAFEKVLVHYDFAAGRVRLNDESGRLEIDCNAAGAGFVVASSEFSLDEIGELVYPNPGYKHLAAQKLDVNNKDQPICIFQVTSFKCGGFSIGLSGNHMLYDGTGTRMFLENVASQAFENRPLAVIPCYDRHLLEARSPPRVTFPHPEFLKVDLLDKSKISIFSVQEEVLDSKIFTLSSNHINYLKNKAKSINSGTKCKSTTTFNVVAALVWRCKALSMDINENDPNKDRVSRLLYAVEVRSKLNPPLPPTYCGNAVLNAYASAKCRQLEKGPFSELVEMVSDGISRVTNEYVRSALDWLESNKGVIVPNGDYLISSWSKLGYEKVVYPWGKSICSCPVKYYRKDICMFFPNVDDGGEMNILVTLPPEEMKRFQSLFIDFFEPPHSYTRSKL